MALRQAGLAKAELPVHQVAQQRLVRAPHGLFGRQRDRDVVRMRSAVAAVGPKGEVLVGMDAAAEPVGTAPAAGAAANARRAVRRPIRTVGRMRMWARVASSSTVMDARGARRGPLHPASAPSPTVSVMDAAQGSDMRFLLVVRDFGGMTSGAVRQDLKVGVERLRTWKRIALVTDLDRMTRLSAFFGWMTPGGTKAFPLAAREEASARASGRDPDARPARGPAR